MKKLFNIALTAVLALGFAACSDDDPYLGQPVVNPQEPIMPADGVSATDMVAEAGSVNLDAAAKADGYVTMLNVTELKNFPAGAEFKVVMNVSASQDMAGAQAITLNTVPGTAAGSVYTLQAPAAEWDTAFKSLVSRDPSAQTMYVNYVAYAVEGTTEVLLGTIGTAQSVVVTPIGYEHPLETEYYIYGTINDGTVANAVKLNHSGNQYDNPVFAIKIDVTSAELNANNGAWNFKVIPASTKNAGQTWDQNHSLTFIGAGANDGTLAYATATEDVEWATITTPGSYMLSINLLDLTFEVANAIEYVYMPGTNNDWSSWSTKLFTSDYIKYTGFANLTGDFKFTGIAGWNNDFGNWGKGASNYDLQNGSNDNFKVDGTPGLYWISLDLPALKYTKTYIEKIGVVGSHNGWNAGGAPLLTPSADNLVWEGEFDLTEGGEFKFCMNGGWDINLGGDEDNLSIGGKNLVAPSTGKFLIVLDLSTIPYQCYIEEQ